MTGLMAKEKSIVVPGEVLATGMDFLPAFGTRRQNDAIVALRVGIVSVEGRAIRIVPLGGKYAPKNGDTILAKVVDVTLNGWRLDINCAYQAMLGLKDATSEYIVKGADLTQYYNFGDYIVTKIVQVTTQKLIDVTMRGPGMRRLGPGRILTVSPNKVPRIIGKRGSMVGMIKLATNSRIIVGQNGIIWLSAENSKDELLAVKTIEKIQREAHVTGLTDAIKAYLEKETGKPVDLHAAEQQNEERSR